jgi:Family of unknown function (DUF6275)
MSDDVTPAYADEDPVSVSPTPLEMARDVERLTAAKNNQKQEPPKRETFDPDRFLMMSKKVVVDNYNLYRDSRKSPELTMDAVYIVWFSKTLGNWKAIVASPVVRGLLWEVAFNAHKNEAYVDIYKKLNNVKVSLGGSS